MPQNPKVPFELHRYPEAEMRERARSVFEEMDQRRSVRDFSPEPVPREVIVDAVRAASTAPSGAHRQP
jgi:iodotyrosine deiodinase